MRHTYKNNIEKIQQMKEFFKTNPGGIVKIHEKGNLFPIKQTKEQFYTWLKESVNARINRNEPTKGRKDNTEYYFNCLRLSRMVNSRTVVRENDFYFDHSLLPRLKHRISTDF